MIDLLRRWSQGETRSAMVRDFSSVHGEACHVSDPRTTHHERPGGRLGGRPEKNIVSYLLAVAGALWLPALKSSYIVGSFWKFFSLKSSLVPLAGAFGGIGGGLVFCMIRLLVGGFTVGLSLSSLALYIPGLCGGLYWASRSRLMRLGVPLLCMILFCVHPVGGEAWVYSLFWLIPMMISCMRHNSILLESLACTYTMHAVGSVLWLYTVPMTSAMWLGLIPLVPIERALFALAMTGFYYGICMAEVMLRRVFAWGMCVSRLSSFCWHSR